MSLENLIGQVIYNQALGPKGPSGGDTQQHP